MLLEGLSSQVYAWRLVQGLQGHRLWSMLINWEGAGFVFPFCGTSAELRWLKHLSSLENFLLMGELRIKKTNWFIIKKQRLRLHDLRTIWSDASRRGAYMARRWERVGKMDLKTEEVGQSELGKGVETWEDSAQVCRTWSLIWVVALLIARLQTVEREFLSRSTLGYSQYRSSPLYGFISCVLNSVYLAQYGITPGCHKWCTY